MTLGNRPTRAEMWRTALKAEDEYCEQRKTLRKGVIEDVYAVLTDLNAHQQASLLHAAMCANLGHCHMTHWPTEEEQYVYEQLTRLIRG